ncbi:MAG: DUF3100 domain-containing protein [Methanosphaera sp.]|nr:DUF3100 domain-containing protein [Methanosphaera sp.]MEE3418999.1 DUF3100 domain-containing protein [Methanosphaera sp.]
MDDNISNKKSCLNDYKLHLTILFISIISLTIGTITIHLYGNVNLIILPFIPALFIAISFYLIKSINWINYNQSKTCTKLILLLIGPLLVKLAIASGQNISLLFDIGPLLILKELGSIGTILIGLPIALLLGFKREAIGMTSSICREPQLAVLIEKYGFDSAEVKGFFIVYIIGIVLGTIFISFLVNLLPYCIPLHPYSYALATGIGSTSMNVAALSSLTSLYPDISENLLTLSGISNMISLMFGIYVYIFISLPLTEMLYNKIKHYFK